MGFRYRAYLTCCIACRKTNKQLVTLVRKNKDNPATMICLDCKRWLDNNKRIEVKNNKEEVIGVIHLNGNMLTFVPKEEVKEI